MFEIRASVLSLRLSRADAEACLRELAATLATSRWACRLELVDLIDGEVKQTVEDLPRCRIPVVAAE